MRSQKIRQFGEYTVFTCTD